MVDKTSFQNSLKLIITLWGKLSTRRKRQLYFVFVIMLITGLALSEKIFKIHSSLILLKIVIRKFFAFIMKLF